MNLAQRLAQNREAYQRYFSGQAQPSTIREPPLPESVPEAFQPLSAAASPPQPEPIYRLEGPSPLSQYAMEEKEGGDELADQLLRRLEQEARRDSQSLWEGL